MDKLEFALKRYFCISKQRSGASKCNDVSEHPVDVIFSDDDEDDF